jgi:hypothetical protein
MRLRLVYWKSRGRLYWLGIGWLAVTTLRSQGKLLRVGWGVEVIK